MKKRMSVRPVVKLITRIDEYWRVGRKGIDYPDNVFEHEKLEMLLPWLSPWGEFP